MPEVLSILKCIVGCWVLGGRGNLALIFSAEHLTIWPQLLDVKIWLCIEWKLVRVALSIAVMQQTNREAFDKAAEFVLLWCDGFSTWFFLRCLGLYWFSKREKLISILVIFTFWKMEMKPHLFFKKNVLFMSHDTIWKKNFFANWACSYMSMWFVPLAQEQQCETDNVVWYFKQKLCTFSNQCCLRMGHHGCPWQK